jgi:hypothetical protein
MHAPPTSAEEIKTGHMEAISSAHCSGDVAMLAPSTDHDPKKFAAPHSNPDYKMK